MDHTVTTADVKRIAAEEAAKVLRDGSKKSATEVRQGTRTSIHAMLQEQLPVPYAIALPPRNADGSPKLFGDQRNADIAARKKAMHASVPTELSLEWAQLPPGIGPGTRDQTRDPHHLAQKRHGQALWAEADRLVAAAMGGAT